MVADQLDPLPVPARPHVDALDQSAQDLRSFCARFWFGQRGMQVGDHVSIDLGQAGVQARRNRLALSNGSLKDTLLRFQL